MSGFNAQRLLDFDGFRIHYRVDRLHNGHRYFDIWTQGVGPADCWLRFCDHITSQHPGMTVFAARAIPNGQSEARDVALIRQEAALYRSRGVRALCVALVNDDPAITHYADMMRDVFALEGVAFLIEDSQTATEALRRLEDMIETVTEISLSGLTSDLALCRPASGTNWRQDRRSA